MVLLYVQLTLPPMSLFVFTLAGTLLPPAPVLAGAMLGLLDALLIMVLVLLDETGLDATEGGGLVGDLVPLLAIAVVTGAVVTGVVALVARSIVRAIRPPRVEVGPPAPRWPGGGHET